MKNNYLITILILVISLFLFSIFKNISRPLLWNDEAETAEYARRIVTYGYPKVDDGKNILNLTENPDKSVGVKESIDAWIHSPWGQYYYAVPLELLARNYNDIYIKTGIMRTGFALAGVMGIFIFALIGASFIKDKKMKLVYLILFFVAELLSISLILHLQQVRSYPLNILSLSLAIFVFTFYVIKKKISTILFVIGFLLSSIVLVNVFYPYFFGLVLGGTVYIVVERFFLNRKKTLLRRQKIALLTLFASILISAPFFIFYETFSIGLKFSQLYEYGIETFFSHVFKGCFFFVKQEHFILAMVFKAIIFYKYAKSIFSDKYGREISKMFKLSIFLSVFFIFTIFILARLPLLLDRYLIGLQPVVITILLVDILILFKVRGKNNLSFAVKKDTVFIYLIFLIISASIVFKLEHLGGHVYEMFHDYRGVLDYAIPYIQENYTDTSSLIIATNYEEPSYMYYLNSKVIVGLVGSNIEKDMELEPDIIIVRKGIPNNVDKLIIFLERGSYEMVSFDVYDYRLNNFPELTSDIKHLFKTKLAEKDEEKLIIYINENSKN